VGEAWWKSGWFLARIYTGKGLVGRWSGPIRGGGGVGVVGVK
jgi:hypothetical protein